MIARALLIIAMLTASDIAASQNSRLLPNAQSALNSIASIRAATVATAQYTEYPVSAATEKVVMSYTFAPGSFQVGTQIRIHLYGIMDASVGGFSPTLYVAQPDATEVTLFSYGSSGSRESWCLDAVVTLSVANAKTGNVFGAQNEVVNRTAAAFQAYGFLDMKVGGPLGITDERINTVPVPGPPAPIVVSDQPLQVFVVIDSAIAFAVHGGWMEAM